MVKSFSFFETAVEERNGKKCFCFYLAGHKFFGLGLRNCSVRNIPQLESCKYVHIMNNDKFNKPFVDFLNRHFDPGEHLVLCKREFDNLPFPEGDNVVEIKSLDEVDLNKKNIKKIISHSLIGGAVNYFYKHKRLLKKKIYWGIWGMDLYQAPRNKKNDYVRKNFCGYITGFDRDYACKKYNLNPQKFYKMFAIFPVSTDMLDNVPKVKKNYFRIQINNSCDKMTLDMLGVLAKFKDENVKVTTILSYGQLDFKAQIIELGKNIFGDKFEYVENYMSPVGFANYLAQNDALILNQNRQQGVGNTVASLYLGNKVFIRKDVSTNRYFNEEGIKIYNSEDIENMTFAEFCRYDEKAANQQNVKKYFDESYLAELWKKILEL